MREICDVRAKLAAGVRSFDGAFTVELLPSLAFLGLEVPPVRDEDEVSEINISPLGSAILEVPLCEAVLVSEADGFVAVPILYLKPEDPLPPVPDALVDGVPSWRGLNPLLGETGGPACALMLPLVPLEERLLLLGLRATVWRVLTGDAGIADEEDEEEEDLEVEEIGRVSKI